jgi:uncharacterized membrane protein
MDVIKQLVGRLHPIIVHLPIGFIVLALILQWFDRKKKEYVTLIPLIYLWAGIFAIMACITGYLQYIGEGYAFTTVKWHLWSGIVTALFSFLMYARGKAFKGMGVLAKIPIMALTLLLFMLIAITGHLGGSITHGEDYLVEPLPNQVKSLLGIEIFEEKPIVLNDSTWQKAQFYEDVIKPIMNNNCTSCHNVKKNKGGLQLNTKEGILKGGEHGEIIDLNNPKKSALYARLILPKNDEDHMPPKEKRQPKKEEIRLIETWIAHGHPFDVSIGQLGLSKELFTVFFPKKIDFDYPNVEIAMANTDTIYKIERTGVHVDRISKASNFLSVSCINKPGFTDADFNILLPIAQQIAMVDLGGTQVSDAIFQQLAKLPNLTILKLNNTVVTGKNIAELSDLAHLKSINLSGSHFETPYLEILSNFKNLRNAYLYNTKVMGDSVQKLNHGLLKIDYGAYRLPTIAADSIVY